MDANATKPSVHWQIKDGGFDIGMLLLQNGSLNVILAQMCCRMIQFIFHWVIEIWICVLLVLKSSISVSFYFLVVILNEAYHKNVEVGMVMGRNGAGFLFFAPAPWGKTYYPYPPQVGAGQGG